MTAPEKRSEDEVRRREAAKEAETDSALRWAQSYSWGLNNNQLAYSHGVRVGFDRGCEYESSHHAEELAKRDAEIAELNKYQAHVESGFIHTCYSGCTNLTCSRIREIASLREQLGVAREDLEIIARGPFGINARDAAANTLSKLDEMAKGESE